MSPDLQNRDVSGIENWMGVVLFTEFKTRLFFMSMQTILKRFHWCDSVFGSDFCFCDCLLRVPSRRLFCFLLCRGYNHKRPRTKCPNQKWGSFDRDLVCGLISTFCLSCSQQCKCVTLSRPSGGAFVEEWALARTGLSLKIRGGGGPINGSWISIFCALASHFQAKKRENRFNGSKKLRKRIKWTSLENFHVPTP